MLLRLLLWIILIYIVIKLVRVFTRAGISSSFRSKQPITPPFDNIEEAKFEDITPKPKETDFPNANEPN